MKKIILVLSFILYLGIVSAQEYPEKLNGGKKITKIKNFRGIYDRIYKDVNNEDLVEVCERTFLWPEFWEGENPIYSIKNCQNLNNKSSLTDFLHLENKNIQKFNTFWVNFQERFELERDLLRIENDLRRRTGFNYVFADGESKQKDSPFDLILDLNEIDKIIFGNKKEIPDLKFPKKSSLKMTDDIPFEDQDKWLEQIEPNHKPKNENFSEYNDNFAGNLWHIKLNILRDKLNANALWLQYVGKTMGDKVETDGVFTPSGFAAETHSIPLKSSDKPEAEELTYNPLPKLNAFIQKYIKEQSIIATNSASGNTSRVDQLNNFNAKRSDKNSEILESLDSFEKENSRNMLSNNHVLLQSNLEKILQGSDFFREKIKTINDNILPPFLSKPQHSS